MNEMLLGLPTPPSSMLLNTLISCIGMVAELAAEMPSWVNKETRFLNAYGDYRAYEVPVTPPDDLWVDDVLNDPEPVSFWDAHVETVRLRLWRKTLTSTTIDGVYEILFGFGERANVVMWRVEPVRAIQWSFAVHSA